MTAPSSPPRSPSSPTFHPPPSPVPPPVPVETHPNRGALKRPDHVHGRTPNDLDFLVPEDAHKTYSPPRLRPLPEFESAAVTGLDGTLGTLGALQSSSAATAAAAALRPAVASLRPPPAIPTTARLQYDPKRRSASRKRRQAGGWKKLLWIRQPCTLRCILNFLLRPPLTCTSFRSRQLHRYGDFSRSPPTQPEAPTLRFLALGC